MSEQGISYREFGRLINVSGEAVRKAIDKGRIPASACGTITLKRGTVRPCIIDIEAAKAGWLSNRNDDLTRDKAKLSAAAKAVAAQRRSESVGPSIDPPSPVGAVTVPGVSVLPDAIRDQIDLTRLPDGVYPKQADSKAKAEHFKALREEMDFNREQGLLVEAEAFRAHYTNLVTNARTLLMGVPSKAKAKIPGLTVHDIEALEDLIAEALTGIADGS